jgi:hypothetical protein
MPNYFNPPLQQQPSRPRISYPGGTSNFNYVYGEQIVDERPDSPLNRILTRQPVGPWELVGTAVTDAASTSQSRDRTMLVYAQTVDTARDRYNYRVVDSNQVPLDVQEKTGWKTEGTKLQIPGQSSDYTLNLYRRFK